MLDTKELGGNLTSSKFLLLLGLVHFSSSAYRYVTFGFIRQQMVINSTTPNHNFKQTIGSSALQKEGLGRLEEQEGEYCRGIYLNEHMIKGQPS